MSKLIKVDELSVELITEPEIVEKVTEGKKLYNLFEITKRNIIFSDLLKISLSGVAIVILSLFFPFLQNFVLILPSLATVGLFTFFLNEIKKAQNSYYDNNNSRKSKLYNLFKKYYNHKALVKAKKLGANIDLDFYNNYRCYYSLIKEIIKFSGLTEDYTSYQLLINGQKINIKDFHLYDTYQYWRKLKTTNVKIVEKADSINKENNIRSEIIERLKEMGFTLPDNISSLSIQELYEYLNELKDNVSQLYIPVSTIEEIEMQKQVSDEEITAGIEKKDNNGAVSLKFTP